MSVIMRETKGNRILQGTNLKVEFMKKSCSGDSDLKAVGN